jgi:glycerol-3-phosphate acyltransferase PlsY
MSALLAILLSYFIGAIPVGSLIAQRMRGIDIREHGSGNPGATNVWRVVGKKAGIITLAFDILKGLLPVLFVRWVYPREAGTAALCGLTAIAGHNWSPFLNFKGGKGVATSGGVFLALLPIPTIAALAAFGLTVKRTKHISAGSLAAAVTLPVTAFIVPTIPLYRFAAVAVGIVVIMKHRANIQRLREGTEPRYDEKKD